MVTRNVRLIVLAGVVLAMAVPLRAQESRPKAAAERPAGDARRLPPYFGHVALSNEQREAIFKVRQKHLARIEDLMRQIEQEEQAMMAESEAVLTDAQRQLLEERRRTMGRPGPAPKTKSKDAGKGAGKVK